MAKKKTVEKALNIDSILFNCRDYLRAARNSGSFFEKRDMMLTLVFLRFIGEKYEDGVEKLKQTLKEQGLDPEDENIRAAFFDDATFADGTYNLPPEARWSTIINTPAPKLNVALDTALQRLEEEDPQLKGCFVKGTFTARNLAAFRGKYPVLAICYKEKTMRHLALSYGVEAIYMPELANGQEYYFAALRRLLKEGRLQPTDMVGYLSSGKEGTQTSFLEINVVEDALKHAEDTVLPNNNRYL